MKNTVQIDNYLIDENDTIKSALIKINNNKKGFLFIKNEKKIVLGVVTDGDIRRMLISGLILSNQIRFNNLFESLKVSDNFNQICKLFKSRKINFLPILDNGRLVNIITKKQFHTLLLHDKTWGLDHDFTNVDEGEIDFEVYNRPWGFYKTTMLSSYTQSKIITVFPNEQLSFQEHRLREEHWVIIKGNGEVTLDNFTFDVNPGKYIYIPIGCKHQIINNSNENIVFSEVQLGSYFGESDIIRYSDKYNRI